MMNSIATITVILLLATIWTTSSTSASMDLDDTLYFTSPGEMDPRGHRIRVQGLYGGKINPKQPELARNLFEAGYQCAEYSSDDVVVVDEETGEYNPFGNTELLDQLDVESLSFDRSTNDVLLKVRMEDPAHLTVFQGSLCLGVHACRNNTLKALFYNVQTSDQVSPLALSEGRVYFVLTRTEQLSRRLMLRSVQLRVLDGRCKKDFPLDQNSMFDVNECSELIATLAEEEYEEVVPVQPTSTLLVIPSETDGVEPNFFVQLLYTKRDSATGRVTTDIVLKQVTPDRKVLDTHTERVDRKYFMYEMQHVGGISVKDDLFCWSAFDSIYCGMWDGSSVTNIQRKLAKGQANKVCRAQEPMLADIVTGVAIADSATGDLYFGCMAQIASVGGLGYLQHHEDGKVSLLSVRSNYSGPAGAENSNTAFGYNTNAQSQPGGQPVYAGSLILTDACAHGYGDKFRAVSSAPGSTTSFLFSTCTSMLVLVSHVVISRMQL